MQRIGAGERRHHIPLLACCSGHPITIRHHFPFLPVTLITHSRIAGAGARRQVVIMIVMTIVTVIITVIVVVIVHVIVVVIVRVM